MYAHIHKYVYKSIIVLGIPLHHRRNCIGNIALTFLHVCELNDGSKHIGKQLIYLNNAQYFIATVRMRFVNIRQNVYFFFFKEEIRYNTYVQRRRRQRQQRNKQHKKKHSIRHTIGKLLMRLIEYYHLLQSVFCSHFS